MLKDPNDAATRDKVRELLDQFSRNPEAGFDRILDAGELHQRGGYPPASFFVGLKSGWHTDNALTGNITGPYKPGGTHGELPDVPDLRSSFFLVGPNVPAGKNLLP